MSNWAGSNWKVEFPRGGREGDIGYYEGSCAISFYWEYGGKDVVLIIYVGKPSEWRRLYPWAAERQREILARLATEVIRLSAPDCQAEIEERKDGYTYLLIRK